LSEPNPLRKTFDQEARQYEQARPGYPAALFEDVIAFSGIPAAGRILEIGCGTGQATLPFAQGGYSIDCIELGERLAEIARKNLSAYPQARVWVGAFENFPIEDQSYDLVISATAFHWIDPAIGYHKVARALKPGGSVALFWNKHVQTQAGKSFFESVQNVYREVIPSKAKDYPGLPHPDEVRLSVQAEIEQSGQFGDVTVKKYKWDREYTSRAYIDLLNTYSDHISLEKGTRERLFEGIEKHIESQYGGRIVKEHLTILYLAKKK